MMDCLDGIRIIDLGQGPAAGYCTRLVALLGADVIKVEPPRTGDRLRRAGPFPSDVPHSEASALHLHLNAGKRSVTIDPASPTGASLVRALAARADAVVTCGGDTLHPSLRATPLRQAVPRLVVASITPFGLDGPAASWRATDIVAMAAGGYMSLNGDPDREPITPYGEQAHYQAGIHAALAIVAALRARDRDGVGDTVDAAVAEAATFLTAGAVQRHALMARSQVRSGPRPAGFDANRLYPSTIRPCADGHVHVHCHNRFHDLVSVLMGEPRLAAPDVLESPLGHADEIDALMDGWLATRTREEAVTEAQELRVPMAEVLDAAEVVRLAHLLERRFFTAQQHAVAGPLLQLAAPFRSAGESPAVLSRAPLLGEHNIDVLRGELGLSARDVARLSAAGVV